MATAFAYQIHLQHQPVEITAYGSLYLFHHGVLAIADLHLAKAAHFQKEGIPIPGAVHERDYHRLRILMDRYRPRVLLFLGDLFHSYYNREVDALAEFLSHYPHTLFLLTLGNHDLLAASVYKDMGIQVLNEAVFGDFTFVHDIGKGGPRFTICGHLHPGIALKGLARQHMIVPAFIFEPEVCILPAFGHFTGLAKYTLRHHTQWAMVLHDKLLLSKGLKSTLLL